MSPECLGHPNLSAVPSPETQNLSQVCAEGLCDSENRQGRFFLQKLTSHIRPPNLSKPYAYAISPTSKFQAFPFHVQKTRCQFKQLSAESSIVVHACNPNVWEFVVQGVELGGWEARLPGENLSQKSLHHPQMRWGWGGSAAPPAGDTRKASAPLFNLIVISPVHRGRGRPFPGRRGGGDGSPSPTDVCGGTGLLRVRLCVTAECPTVGQAL